MTDRPATSDRRWLLLGGALAVLAALLGLSLLIALVTPDRNRSACPVAGGAFVVLDPGHGGDDPGAVNQAFGLVEADLVLAIAQRTAALLRADGYSVALTRTDGATTLGNSARGEIANACRARRFAMIHLNSFDDPAVNYVKTFWATEDEDIAFAQHMQTVLAEELRPGTNLAEAGIESFESGALLRAEMPGVLLEPVFLSNPAEASRLADPTGARIEAIARAIAEGIATWR